MSARVLTTAFLLALLTSPAAAQAADPSLPIATNKITTKAPAPAKRAARTRSTVRTGCLPAKIKATLAQIERRWGGHNKVISANRPGATIRGTRHPSLHATCRAVDFYPPRGTKAAVYRWLDESWNGGLGIYNRDPFHHLHIDTGPRLRWVN